MAGYFSTSATGCETPAGNWCSDTGYSGTSAGSVSAYQLYTTDSDAKHQRQEYPRQQEELRKEQEAAVKKAEELLKEHIGRKAFGELHKVGYIELDSQRHKGRKYRVPASHRNLIEVLDEQGRVVDKLCVHPATSYPAADEILTRLVLLESAEEHILDVANHTPVRV